ncbi:ribosome maturation factor RimM [Tissierellaceae bacterium HCP3S3_D8]
MDYTVVGKIINTHGIKGEAKIFPITDDMERFSYLEKAYIGEDKTEVFLQNVRYHKGIVIVKFREFDNINQVIDFIDDFIYVDDEHRIILPDNHYFIHDLRDCDVFDMSGRKIGVVKDVLQTGGNDVYIVDDDINKKEYLIPAVKDFIKKVDVSDKKIVIDPIEGMIE